MNNFQVYLQRRYFASLDGVRFVSILAVIWHHAGLQDVFSRGFLGVDMFFVLSGYLIVTLLLREKNNDHKTINLKHFYIRRALRIFPIYFGVLIALALAYGLLKPNDPDSEQFFSLLPFYLLFVANWSLVHASNLAVYWSLAAEEQFYLIWPLVEKLCRPRVLFVVLGLLMGINQLINFGYLDPLFLWLYDDPEVLNLHILDTTFTPICLGVLLAHLLHREKTFLLCFHFLGRPLSSLIIFILLAVTITFSTGDLSGFPRLFIQVLMCLWIGSLVIKEDHSFQQIMCFYPIKRMGQISYGMYVYHMFILHIIREVLIRYDIEPDYYMFVVGVPLIALVAEISFRLYEKPILSLAKHYRIKH